MDARQKMFGDYRQLKAAGVQVTGGARVTVAVAANRTAGICFKRTAKNPVVFEIGRNARVTITDDCSPTLPALSDVVAGPGSAVDYFINAQTGLPAAFCYQAELSAESSFHWYFWLRSHASSDGVISINQAERSSGSIFGGLVSDEQSEFTLRLTNNHRAKHSRGVMDVKAIGRGSARLTIDGLIRVASRAAFTDSYLTQDGVLVSPAAEIRMVPNLEISNNEVKASHSATVGQLDEHAIHYLTCRGLTPAVARRLLVKGFFGRLLEKIEPPMIKTEFSRLLADV